MIANNAVSESWMVSWLLIPFLIFLARMLDVAFGTLRVIFVAKGFRLLAPALGFVEMIIWLLAIRQILSHINNPMCYLGYGLGFAVGNYIGIRLEERLSLGTVMVRIIPKLDTTDLIKNLRSAGFGASLIDVEGMQGKLKMILIVSKRKDVPELMEIVCSHNPQAFVTVEEVKTAREGYFRMADKTSFLPWLSRVLKSKK